MLQVHCPTASRDRCCAAAAIVSGLLSGWQHWEGLSHNVMNQLPLPAFQMLLLILFRAFKGQRSQRGFGASEALALPCVSVCSPVHPEPHFAGRLPRLRHRRRLLSQPTVPSPLALDGAGKPAAVRSRPASATLSPASWARMPLLALIRPARQHQQARPGHAYSKMPAAGLLRSHATCWLVGWGVTRLTSR
jgi:hypothetical protein